MAIYCNKCQRKIGFFQEDFDGMCKECYEEKLRQEEIEREERIKKAQEERTRLEHEKRMKEEKEREERRKQEEKRKEEEKKAKLEELKEHKKELLKNKLLSNPIILERFNDIIDMIIIEKMNKSGVLTILGKEELEYKYNDFFCEFLFEVLISLYCEIPDNFTLKDIDNINTFTFLDKIRLEFNNSFKETLKQYCFDLEENIDDSYKYSCNSGNLLCDYNDCEKILFDYVGKYVFQNSSSSNRIMHSRGSYLEAGRKRAEYFSKRADICQDEIMLIEFKEVYSYAITILYGLNFSSTLEIIQNNEELNNIYNNLIRATDDKEYISNKLYDMYKNFYEDLFEMNMCPKNFYSLVCFSEIKEFYTYNRLNDNEYQDIIRKLKDSNINDKVQIIVDKIKNSDCISSYIEEWKGYERIGLKRMLIDNIVRGREYINYNDIVLFLKKLYKNIDELIEWNNKQIAIKEKERLLNGDMSKEIEKEELEIEYSNVQNGYEFEEYVANLYKKLGYIIEEVTKKSGDQGADVIAYKDNVKYVIQVKFYNNPVSNKAVQEVVGAIGMYKANKGIVVTNSTFTPSAVELANANNVELVDGEKIEEYKKEIIDSIPNYNENEEITEEYIDEVVNKWNELTEQAQFIQLDDTNRSEIFELLAKVYLEKEFINKYSDERVEEFIKAFSKYTKFRDDVFIENREDRDVIETYIKVAIYKVHFIKEIEDILNDITLNEEEKQKNVFYEYLLDNTEDVCVDYKMIALSEILDISSEDIIDEILYYKEKFESNGEITEYLHSKAQRLLDSVKQYTENLEENEKEKIEYWSSTLQKYIDNDDNSDEDEEFSFDDDIDDIDSDDDIDDIDFDD